MSISNSRAAHVSAVQGAPFPRLFDFPDLMDANELRVKILRLVSEHEATDPAHYLSDKAMAVALGIDVEDVRRQLLILGDSLGLLKLSRTSGPHYAAALTANGMLWLAQEQDTEPDGPPPHRS